VNAVYRGVGSQGVEQAVDRLADSSLDIDDSPGRRLADIRAHATRVRRWHGGPSCGDVHTHVDRVLVYARHEDAPVVTVLDIDRVEAKVHAKPAQSDEIGGLALH
jgi:hypothetical protein